MSKLQLESDLEFLAVSVKNEKHSKIFIVLYRKPSSALNDFFEKLESFLDTVATWKNQTIICGDFNIDSLDASITSENFLTLMNSYGFLQRNFEPTRVTCLVLHVSCIDYIFTKSCLNKINTLKTVISDHYSILLEIDDFKSKNDIKTQSVFRNINPLKNDKNLVDFLFLLHEKLNKMQSSLKADEQITYIVNSLTRILDKFCLLSQVNNKAKPTWITQDIKKQMQKRNMFYKKWIIDPTPTNLEKYKLSRNLTTSLIRNSKLKFYQQKIEKSKNNKSIFQAYNDFIQSKTSAKIEVEADVFNQFFAQIGNKLSGKKVNQKIALRHVKSLPNSMVFLEITTKEVLDIFILF